MKELKLHHAIVGKVRRIEESFRTSPPDDPSLPVLCMSTDGMDQARLCEESLYIHELDVHMYI